jgi:hypothetical protein
VPQRHISYAVPRRMRRRSGRRASGSHHRSADRARRFEYTSGKRVRDGGRNPVQPATPGHLHRAVAAALACSHEQPRGGVRHRLAVPRGGVGVMGLRCDGFERHRHHVRLLRLPHRAGGVGSARPHHTRKLARSGADARGAVRCVVGTGHRNLGRRPESSPHCTRGAHRLGRRDDVGDEPHPRRLPLPVAGTGPAGMHRGVQRSGDGAVQRHAEAPFSGGELGPDIRDRFGRRIFRQCDVAVDPVSGLYRWRRRYPRPAGPRGGRRPAHPCGDAARGGMVRLVRAPATGLRARPRRCGGAPRLSVSLAPTARCGTR